MRRPSIHAPFALALAGLVVLCTVASAADRPRLRPTPEPPVATSGPVDPGASAVPSSVPAPTAAADPSSAPPADGDCLSLERPDPMRSPAPVASGAPAASGAPTAAPTTTPAADPDATSRVKLPVVGLRLDLPGDWIGLEGDDLAALEDIPELTQALEALDASSLVFLGVDVLPGEGCAIGADLSLYDLGEALDDRLLALSVEAIALGLEELDEVAGDVKVSTVDLPVGEAQRLTFRFDATDDGALTTWWVRADVFTASGRTLLAAYAAPDAISDEAKAVFTAIARSIREL